MKNVTDKMCNNLMFYNLNKHTKELISLILEDLRDILEDTYGDSLSHGMDHVREVMLTALTYNQKLDLRLDPKEIILASLLHDMYQNTQRELHHQLGYEYVMRSTHKVFYGIECTEDIDRKRVAKAILEHRASYKGKYYSLLSELIASADRSYPDLYKIVERCFVYTIETNPNMSIDEIGLAVKKHIKEKYSKDGYIKYPKLYLKMYGNKIEELHNDVDMFLNGEKLVIIEHNGSTITLGSLPLL